MLDQKVFGEKLRNHRKKSGMTQEEVAEKIGVSPQAISKWESGDCLPDCFNLKSISDIYQISADVLLETESSGDIDSVARKIEQIGTEYIWASANCGAYNNNLHQELGEDLWKMWKGIYFAETGNRKIQEESKQRGNLRISGNFGMKIWDDDGIVCIVKSSLMKNLGIANSIASDVISALCSEDGQKLITALNCTSPTTKDEIISQTNIEIHRLNELLLLLSENKVIEHVADNRVANATGYKISGHCGIVAYMILSAMHILTKQIYEVSEYLFNPFFEE